MDTSKYDNEIENLIRDVDTIRSKMSPILEKFLSDTVITVSNYYKEKIKWYVISNPEITKDNGQVGISNLKSGCREILENLPEKVKEKVGSPELWSHQWPIEQLKSENFQCHAYSTHYNVFELKENINDALNYTLKDLKELLLKYHYIQNNGMLGFSVECSPEMKDSLKKYMKIDKKLAEITIKIVDLEKTKAEAEAEDLWDRA